MAVLDPVIDPEIVTEMKAILAEHVDKKFVDFDQKVERRMKELSARGPGAFLTGGGAPTTCALLGGDTKFRDWLRQGRGRMSRYAANYAGFRIETKAGPLLSPALPTNVSGISGPPELSLRLVELMPIVNLGSGGSVEYVKEATFVPGADIQIEGAVKAATDITFAPATTSIKTIATILKASLQAVAGAPDPLFAPPTGATALDTIGAAIGQLAAAGYTPNGVVMSGSDVNKMKLLKNSTGDYLWASPNSSVDTSQVWRVPLVISPSMPAGSWLVGAFTQSTVLYSRQMLVVDIAYENEDDFIRNLACLRAEERIGLASPVPAGLLKGTFAPATALAANRK